MAQRMWEMSRSQVRLPRPPPPALAGPGGRRLSERTGSCCTAGDSATYFWDSIFAEAYRADVCVYTTDGVIPAHSIVLGMASPVMKNMLRQSKSQGGRRRSISIRGVPHDAVRVFLRFIYSSCCDQQEMQQYVLHLLVLSHSFMIPSLKKICVKQLERGLLSIENVVDVYQLAQLCDAPRLRLLCHRMIVSEFKDVCATDGWKVMRRCNPHLEKELLESVIDADSRNAAKSKKLEEMKIYLQLHEAMEALVHICRDGCRTIGPHDKILKPSAGPCEYPACKGLEALVKHFAGCKNRVLGKCTHCKRMWQLLELHSRLCTQLDGCKVPLCGHFKEKLKHQAKKDEVKWKLLVSKVLEAKRLVL